MSRMWLVVLLVGCAQPTPVGPHWDVSGYPQVGRTYEGAIELRVWWRRLSPQSVVAVEDIALVTWPEGESVDVEITQAMPSTGDEAELYTVVPTVLDPNRWYALRWSAPFPFEGLRSMRLGTALQVDEHTFAWPFWGGSGPFITGAAVSGDDGLGLTVGFSDNVVGDVGFVGLATQGSVECEVEPLPAPYVGGGLRGTCSSPLERGVPFHLSVSGLRSAGTGAPVESLELDLVLDEDGSAPVPPPRAMPAAP